MRRMGLLLAATRNCAGDCSGTNDPDRLIGSNNPQIMLGFASCRSVHEASKKGDAR